VELSPASRRLRAAVAAALILAMVTANQDAAVDATGSVPVFRGATDAVGGLPRGRVGFGTATCL